MPKPPAIPNDGDSSAATPSPPRSTESPSFEEAYQELQSLVQLLERGDITLAQSLEHYERGVRCLKHCYAALEEAERRVEILQGRDATGEPIVQPFDEQTMSLEQKAASRGTRRSQRSSTTEPPTD